MSQDSRIKSAALRQKIMPAEAAADLITPGSTVGMSGFTGSGYPKVVPQALAKRMEAATAAGNKFRLRVWTGASTGPELDGALAKADGIEFRLPYNSDPIAREMINCGRMEYFDMHLSQVAPMAWQGFLGPLDTALIEVSGITEDGSLIPSSSVGNNKTWLDRAEKIILEVNSWQNAALDGMHDIYYGTALPPNRVPIPLVKPDDRIGQTYLPRRPVEDRGDRGNPGAGPQPALLPAGQERAADRRAPHRVLRARGEEGPPAAEPAAAAIGRRQHRQRSADRAERIPFREHDFLHGGDPGRHAGHADLRQAAHGFRHRVLAEPEAAANLNANMEKYRTR